MPPIDGHFWKILKDNIIVLKQWRCVMSSYQNNRLPPQYLAKCLPLQPPACKLRIYKQSYANKCSFFTSVNNHLRYESEKKFMKQVKAQKLWFAILESQTETGTPYMLYKDACNRKSNQQVLVTCYLSYFQIHERLRLLEMYYSIPGVG